MSSHKNVCAFLSTTQQKFRVVPYLNGRINHFKFFLRYFKVLNEKFGGMAKDSFCLCLAIFPRSGFKFGLEFETPGEQVGLDGLARWRWRCSGVDFSMFPARARVRPPHCLSVCGQVGHSVMARHPFSYCTNSGSFLDLSCLPLNAKCLSRAKKPRMSSSRVEHPIIEFS